MKKKVLIMTAYYTPAVKGGGPIQSIKNLVDHLSDKFDFNIVVSDRDMGDDKPFKNIIIDEWLSVGNAKVLYTDFSKLTWKKTISIINSIDYDIMYLNSFFSYKTSIVPIFLSKFKRIPRKPIVVAPRGEFSQGALGLKKVKKKNYIYLTKVLGLYKNVKWHATAESEKKDIMKVFGSRAKIYVVHNLIADYRKINYEKNIAKEKGKLKIIFISRIHPMKNLKKAISFLNNIEGEIELNVFGPIEDREYWTECKNEIKKLPDNISVSYKGIINQESVLDAFKSNHVFLFPTLGENFGHVISEALIGGCPVIISDQTPWRELKKKGVGWDISLSKENKFASLIQYCVNMDNRVYESMSVKAYEYGKSNSNQEKSIELYLELLK